MNVSYIYFDELKLNNEKKCCLDFSSNSQVTNPISFTPEKNYFTKSVFCPLNIKPDISKSAKKYKEINELSDFGEALESNASNLFLT